MCAYKLGKYAATVDVAHKQHGGGRHFGHAHVHDVVVLEVDLGRAACTFDDHDVVTRGQVIVGRLHGGNEARLVFEVVAGCHVRHGFAHNDDLRPHVGCGFEEDGVHRRLGGDAAGLCLQCLGAPDLKATWRDRRVERHVLRLERGHRKAVLGKDAAETCGDEALACA